MKNYGKVAVVMGGNSPEREISFLSGRAVLAALLARGIDAYAFDPAEEPLGNLAKNNTQIALLMIHGKNGEDGKLQGMCEYLKLPYTGSGVMASSIGMDKYRTKLIWQTLGIPVADSQYIEKANFNKDTFKLKLKLPVVVKPADDGSTLGLSKVYQESELSQAIDYAFNTSNKVLIEQLIIGDEYSVTILDDIVYSAVKIEAPQNNYDYQNKYFTDDTKYICPTIMGKWHDKAIKHALEAYHAIGATGVARVDIMLDKDDNYYLLEINTIPGMTNHSITPIAAAAAGVAFNELCLKILDGAGLDK